MNQNEMKQATIEFRVDEYNCVYDADGVFYCTWDQLSEGEKEVVELNPMSAR
jgi:hypothetical protein